MPYRKSIVRKLLESKRKQYANMRQAKARKREHEQSYSGYAFTVRVYRLAETRQVVVKSDGLNVWIDGGRTRTYDGFCRAMNRKLWKRTKGTNDR